jgi:hypothetical protein
VIPWVRLAHHDAPPAPPRPPSHRLPRLTKRQRVALFAWRAHGETVARQLVRRGILRRMTTGALVLTPLGERVRAHYRGLR